MAFTENYDKSFKFCATCIPFLTNLGLHLFSVALYIGFNLIIFLCQGHYSDTPLFRQTVMHVCRLCHGCTPLPQQPYVGNSYYNPPFTIPINPPVPTFGILN